MKCHLLFLLFYAALFSAQQDGFLLRNGKKKVTIPFQFINNLIFIPVTVNGVPLPFLLDSGVSETIIFSFDEKEISFPTARKTLSRGLGGQNDAEGFEVLRNRVEISKDLSDDQQTVYIIFDPEFNISSHEGIPVNGVIGFQVFKNYQFKINYISKKITFYGDGQKINLKSFETFDLDIELNKPYLITAINQENEKLPAMMLVDIGNSDAVWLFPEYLNKKTTQPSIEDYLGRGFNGDIYGKRSRINEIGIGDFSFKNPVEAIPDETSVRNVKLAKDRKGSIGDEIVRCFHVVTDYPNKKLYLKPNAGFSETFNMDMCGLYIKHNGMQWEKDMVRTETSVLTSAAVNEVSGYSSKNEFHYKFSLKPEYVVGGTRKNSPSEKAGLQKNDRIVKINGKRASDYTLEKISRLMKSESGKKSNITVERSGKQLNFEFMLENPLPH